MNVQVLPEPSPAVRAELQVRLRKYDALRKARPAPAPKTVVILTRLHREDLP